ncbi:hypothetical protein J6590_036056 [Homalodisca vitripennis]|nr:hypothetical protein J6590_036056 [Homalodisca vitripennis]
MSTDRPAVLYLVYSLTRQFTLRSPLVWQINNLAAGSGFRNCSSASSHAVFNLYHLPVTWTSGGLRSVAGELKGRSSLLIGFTNDSDHSLLAFYLTLPPL